MMMAIAMLICVVTSAQEQQLTRDQILNMSFEELSDLPFDKLMSAAETLGVSSVDELFAMIMNKNLSSASKKEESAFTSPLSSTVITRDELRSYGVSTIEEALRFVPGVIVSEKYNGVNDVQIRGLNNIPDNHWYLYTENANTILMVDGRPIQNQGMGALNIEMLPVSIEDIAQIEVVRGAVSAMYGIGAVTGVINIVTEKPSVDSKMVSGQFKMGNYNTMNGEVAYRKAINNKLAVGFSVNMNRRDRTTSKIYMFPQDSTSSTDLYLQSVGAEYFTNPDGVSFSETELQDMINKGYLTSVGKGGEFTKVELKRIRNASKDAAKNSLYTNFSQLQGVMSLLMAAAPQLGVELNANMSNDDIAATVIQVYPLLQQSGILADTDFADLNDVELKTYAGYCGPAIKSNLTEMSKIYQFKSLDGQVSLDEAFADPSIAREGEGVNAYLSFTPNNDVRFDFSTGFMHNKTANTPISDWAYALTYREFNNYYANMNANVYGANVAVSYTGGPQSFIAGNPSFSVHYNNISVRGDYSFNFKGLVATPSVNYNYVRYVDDKDKMPNDYLSSGFFNSEAQMKLFGAGMRLDYKLGRLRLIGNAQFDKTDAPNKWNPAWQLAANYMINDNNFARVVYGNANRAPVFVNTCSNYTWNREGMGAPNNVELKGNPDANLVKVRNIELGYRWKPSPKLLVDAEMYGSWSKDYGRLSASRSMLAIDSVYLRYIIGAVMDGTVDYSDPSQVLAALGNFDRNLVLDYQNLPFKVQQLGASVNVDWIITPKLIAKANVNWQRTTINNYYEYHQGEHVVNQFTKTTEKAMKLTGLMDELSELDSKEYQKQYVNQSFVYTPTYEELSYFDGLSDEQQADLLSQLKIASRTQQSVSYDGRSYDAAKVAGYYVSYKYSIARDSESGNYFFGSSNFTEPEKKTVEHKSTPSFYGVVGLICHPTDKLNISAFANFMSARTIAVSCGSVEVDPKFTLNLKAGYKVSPDFELFGTANNLFANGKRDFAYTDPQKAMYSVGVNFAF